MSEKEQLALEIKERIELLKIEIVRKKALLEELQKQLQELEKWYSFLYHFF